MDEEEYLHICARKWENLDMQREKSHYRLDEESQTTFS